MRVHREKPFVDGRTFVDTFGMEDSVKSELCYAGMIFLTSFKVGGKEYGGDIIARDFEHAKTRADERGLGETVVGKLEIYGHLEDRHD